jgi:hypothetical protein
VEADKAGEVRGIGAPGVARPIGMGEISEEGGDEVVEGPFL